VGSPGLRAPVECRSPFGEHPAEEVKHTSCYHGVYAHRASCRLRPDASTLLSLRFPLLANWCRHARAYRAIAGRMRIPSRLGIQ